MRPSFASRVRDRKCPAVHGRGTGDRKGTIGLARRRRDVLCSTDRRGGDPARRGFRQRMLVATAQRRPGTVGARFDAIARRSRLAPVTTAILTVIPLRVSPASRASCARTARRRRHRDGDRLGCARGSRLKTAPAPRRAELHTIKSKHVPPIAIGGVVQRPSS